MPTVAVAAAHPEYAADAIIIPLLNFSQPKTQSPALLLVDLCLFEFVYVN